MGLETCCDRPKSLVSVTIKVPEELVEDMDFFRALHRPVKTRSDYIKDALEFVGIIKHGSRLGLYTLRDLEKNLHKN